MKKLTLITGLLLSAILLISAACSKTESVGESAKGITGPGIMVPGDVVEEERAAASTIEPSPSLVAPGGDFASEDDGGFAGDRMIVRTGQMALIVEDVRITIEEITTLADGFEGYVVSSRVWKLGQRQVGSISIRVPAEHFNDTTRMLRGLAVEVTSETSDSRDVTEEYTDLTSRLANLEATELQLLAILEKAQTVEEILNVQRELSRTRGEIEQTKGRMQYLERTSATSLINITLEQSKLNIELFANKTRAEEREQVLFSAEITGGFPPYSYQWDLGDGTTSTEGNPRHAYTKDGTYSVSLTVTDDRANRLTKTRTDYITVLSGWEAGNIASNAWDGLVVFGQYLANIVIWLGVFSPLWIGIGAITYAIIRWRRRRKKSE
ncbi:MAG: DUF4349 domain-containing protein [Dehalococcoidales bacterium]